MAIELNIDVVFKPTQAKSYSDTVDIVSDATSSPDGVIVTGKGIKLSTGTGGDTMSIDATIVNNNQQLFAMNDDLADYEAEFKGKVTLRSDSGVDITNMYAIKRYTEGDEPDAMDLRYSNDWMFKTKRRIYEGNTCGTDNLVVLKADKPVVFYLLSLQAKGETGDAQGVGAVIASDLLVFEDTDDLEGYFQDDGIVVDGDSNYKTLYNSFDCLGSGVYPDSNYNGYFLEDGTDASHYIQRTYITDTLILKWSSYETYFGMKKFEEDANVTLEIYGKNNTNGGDVA